MQYPEVMLDLETTATDPSHGAIIQLSAVRFNLEEQAIDMDMFDQCLLIPGNRFWEQGTQDWWVRECPDVLDAIWPRMRDPFTVLQAFNQWVVRDLNYDRPVMWAKPIHFEFPFLQSYYKQYDLSIPFHYSEAQDLRSWCRAKGIPNLDRELDFQGTKHNAIHDVLHQILTLFNLMERTNDT
jgi:DNA polymerase III alpha subunit (gram-positive type)